MAKEKHQPFWCSNRILKWDWNCELVGLFLLNNLANKFDKNSVGLYRDDDRDDGLA